MTTTVTTVTVTTVTTVGLVAGLGLLTSLALVALLIGKELATAVGSSGAARWGRTINIGLVPLLLAFAVIVAAKLAHLF